MGPAGPAVWDKPMSFRAKWLVFLLAVGLALGAAGAACARAGMGFSMGSRGFRTYSMPAPTPISPYAAPLRRSTLANPSYFPPNSGYPFGFGRGFLGGVIGGFLGAGLIGLLFGHSFFGGGFSLLGLLLQIGLIYLLIRFALAFFGNRQPAFYGKPGTAGAGSWQGGYAPQSAGPAVSIAAQDYDAFERCLGEVQEAYANEDIDRLRRVATPEMASYFAEEFEGHAQRGQVNRLSGVKLLQGHLAEAWREGGAEYASVAMRFSLIDVMVERASGRIISGNPDVPDVATEVWTFVRPAGGGPDDWKLSAIQQA